MPMNGEDAVTQIKQDTEAVHLLKRDGGALSGGIDLSEWAGGFVATGQGARICRACQAKATELRDETQGLGLGAPRDIA